MAQLFYAHKAVRLGLPCYFIESTAPNNVDDGPEPEPTETELGGELAPIDADAAVAEIADHLARAQAPNLVVMVHGFNNPRLAALGLYQKLATAAAADPFVKDRRDLICIGYRWPSEKITEPLSSTRQALPAFPADILGFGAAAVVALLALYLVSLAFDLEDVWWLSLPWHLLVVASLAGIGLVVVGMLLRIVVYFRDGYRAINYAVPDLLEVIRQIDAKVNELSAGAPKRIDLSFIGHSMGAYVVTNAIRALTDLFAPDSLRPSLNSGTIVEPSAQVPMVRPEIGHVFRLKRFLLASPDIPAETLMSNRANFLEPSLRRFEEAYLFGNEGDEVLRLISTTANYFSFPTKSSTFGYRLGNVEILSRGYGVIEPPPHELLRSLRVGANTLHALYKELRDAGLAGEKRKASVEGAKASYQKNLASLFSYFDCTDYVDVTGDGGPARGLLTYALKRKAADATARLGFGDQARLLIGYLRGGPNVHGGYFDGVLSRQLIVRLACLGYAATLESYGGADAFAETCEARQIRVVISPHLAHPDAVVATAEAPPSDGA